ncbi:DNA-processing protein DprA [Candidatus Cetobacterium colombiensis]|uniref:DNA-processing protein DprA n=1 Tax=Candidatus Cetobacterium colombiensis TaxID=3073100 RepID=A0ABU4WA13_9FUSO|nr:DNA-processing protein DprA [Candidatus Cetobacterium colombiensis]MDX8336374.1 DNA-processing protein DprA [Candidatus Cetobacterium colombiensis]
MEWYRLKLMGLKSSKIRVLMAECQRYNDIFIKLEELIETLNLTKDDTDLILNSKKCEKYLEMMDYLEKNKIGLLDINDYRYPENLKNIAKPPLFLFYKGNIELLNKERLISIIGTRRATKYGELGCEKIVKDLVDGDVVVVSGLALGIDSIAHNETLKYKGNTVAVLGCGIDIYYPKTNISLRKEIEKNGVVISEFPLGMNPTPGNFPIRNRIIAGLSKGTIIIESSLKGGSLITANLSLEEGRDVFALPGDITYPFSQGCNNLIKLSQAKLLTSGEDILNEYNWSKKNREGEKLNKLIGIKLKIYNTLKTKMHLEEIKREISCNTSELLSNLMELEIEGYVQSLPAGYYRRRL